MLVLTIAHAYPAKETEILSTTSYAVATAAQKNRKGAEAYCRQAKSTLTKKPEEAYLYAHIERCFALVADTAGDKPMALQALQERTRHLDAHTATERPPAVRRQPHDPAHEHGTVPGDELREAPNALNNAAQTEHRAYLIQHNRCGGARLSRPLRNDALYASKIARKLRPPLAHRTK